MASGIYNTSDTCVQMLMVLKIRNLQQNGLPSLTYDNLEDYLNDIVWKDHVPLYLSTAAEEIRNIRASDIVKYLSDSALTAGRKEKLNNFSDLLGGN